MSNPVRVLHVVQRMEAGGTQSLLMNLYRHIDRERLQFDFLVEYTRPQFHDTEIERLGGHIHRTSVREDYNVPQFCRQLRALLKTHPEYRIMHVHPYTIGAFALPVAQRCGVPVRIAHSHNNETVRNLAYLPKLAMQRLYARHATDLFACSHEAGEYLFRGRPFHVIRNAIDTQAFRADAATRTLVRRELGLDAGIVIGHVGRFHEQKNHRFLIDTFSHVLAREPSAMLLLIGDGPLEPDIRREISHRGLSGHVLMPGTFHDISRIYQAMDVFVLPSLFEGLGMVAIEAQAVGVPTLVSDTVSMETRVSPIYARMPLQAGPEAWADRILDLADMPQAHTDMSVYIRRSGYDAAETARAMQDWYIRRWEETQ